MGVNIRLHLAKEGEELSGGAAGGATLELVFEKEREEEAAAEKELEYGEDTEQNGKREQELKEEEEKGDCENQQCKESTLTDSCSAGLHSDPNP